MSFFKNARRRPLAEQVVVVTGASSGVGRAIARAFGAAGAKVGLIARGREALENCAKEIEAEGGEALVLPLDVADDAAVEAAADAVVQRWGRIDTWVNDAMVSVFSRALEMTAQEFKRVTEVNYLGAVHGTLAALRRMKDQPGGGGIIQIGSALVYRSIPLQSAYCASKAAMRGFTDSLRSEILHDRLPVAISMLQLPAVNTPQFDVVRSRLPNWPQPVPPIYQPEVIARACLYVAEHPVRELWIAPAAIKAIMGQELAPGFADRYLARNGFDSQQTPRPSPPGRPDNVDRPLPGDRGAHGRFDSQARSFSAELWLRMHPLATAIGVAVLVGVLLEAANRTDESSPRSVRDRPGSRHQEFRREGRLQRAR